MGKRQQGRRVEAGRHCEGISLEGGEAGFRAQQGRLQERWRDYEVSFG